MNLTVTTFNHDGTEDFLAFFVAPDEDITIEVGSEIKVIGASNHAIDEPIPIISEVPPELGVVLWRDAVTLYPVKAAVDG